MNLDYKTLLVVDTGQAVEFAVRLARDYGRVMYYAPYQEDFPVAAKVVVGDIDNVERVEELWEAVDQADIIAFPSSGFASMQQHLKAIGKRVWGSAYGEYLETDRVAFKHWLEQNHLPCVPYEVVEGMDKLRNYMKANKDVYVKLPQYVRGNTETFHSLNWELSEHWWMVLRTTLGPLGDHIKFVVEHKVEGFETGTDRFTIDGKFPKCGLMGHEVKDKAYVGKVLDKYPDAVDEADEFLAAWFRQTQYRNLYSTETRITEDGKSYFIDLAARMPSPPGDAELEDIKNLGTILWAGSEGVLEEPDWIHPYVVELNLENQWAETNWTPVSFPAKFRHLIKLQNASQSGSIYWLAPTPTLRLQKVTAVGLGDTVEEAIKQALEVAESIECGGEAGFSYNSGTIPDAQEAIAEAEKYGIKW